MVETVGHGDEGGDELADVVGASEVGGLGGVPGGGEGGIDGVGHILGEGEGLDEGGEDGFAMGGDLGRDDLLLPGLLEGNVGDIGGEGLAEIGEAIAEVVEPLFEGLAEIVHLQLVGVGFDEGEEGLVVGFPR